MFKYYFMFVKNPRKFSYVWKKNRVPQVSEKNQTPKNHLDRLIVFRLNQSTLAFYSFQNRYISPKS